MDNTPVLMENTKIMTYTIYNEKVYKRNKRNMRIVYARDVSPNMEESAGLPVGTYSNLTEPVKKDVPVKAPTITPEAPEATITPEAPEATEAPEAPEATEAPEAVQRPDFTDWDEDKLREFTQEHDIPIHPHAKTTGLQAAITRYFDELEVGGD